MTRIIALFILLFSLSASAIADETYQYQSRVAIVDVEAILEKSLAVQSVRKSIDKMSEDIHKEMSTKEETLRHLESEIIKKRGVVSEAVFDKEVAEFEKKVSDAHRLVQEKKAKLERSHAEAMAKVHKVTIDIIHDMSKKRGFNIALRGSQVLYATSDLDITEDVIEALNSKLKSVQIK